MHLFFSKAKQLVETFFSKRMLVIFFLGFSSGLPIMLVGAFLKLWLRRSGVDLSTIGMLSWVLLPYTLNFLIGPFMDRFIPLKLGRRRSWLIITQLLLTAALFTMGLFEPSTNLNTLIVIAILIASFSAAQDVAVDAYRRERLPDQELGIGSSFGVFGYRIAMLVAWGWGPWMVGKAPLLFAGIEAQLSYGQIYQVMAGFMLIGVVTTCICLEPKVEHSYPDNFLATIKSSFFEFFQRKSALYILGFIFLYKLGDAFAGSLLPAYYVDVGFTDKQVGTIAGMFGLASSITALAVGGSIVYYMGFFKALWVCGFLQALSTASFAILKLTGPSTWALTGVILFEDFSSGMGTAALVAFMASIANKKFTATQYALFSSLASSGRSVFAGFAGFSSAYLGWKLFFITGGILAIPGLVMLYKVQKNSSSKG